MEISFTKDYVQMAGKCIKTCLTSLKLQYNDYYLLTRTAQMKKQQPQVLTSLRNNLNSKTFVSGNVKLCRNFGK